MMIPAVLEKIGYGAPMLILFLEKRINPGDLLFTIADLLFAVLFVISFFKTKSLESRARG
jgi:ABC-type spermidine/putrescine transport system permease subunit II